MVEFAYNNTKITNISYILFKLNYKYYLYISYKKNFDLCLKSKIAKKISFKL